MADKEKLDVETEAVETEEEEEDVETPNDKGT